MAENSLFARLQDANEILEVDMNEVQILEPDDDDQAFGTQNLNGCSGIVVLGTRRVIQRFEELEDTCRVLSSRSPLMKGRTSCSTGLKVTDLRCDAKRSPSR
ncbi:hypothetical protein Tdes44962_MAKER01653 [Teratosphaeria destructans]|uniref:Uncharacterized protein n=1 Tax=Teratosphaeria destructans TaxID=418781 RepID=A0A9W7W5B2_9PEZI|nr:hypothetical protein Tdes44962_MAKER01653 [Teratosphaeria destructans]